MKIKIGLSFLCSVVLLMACAACTGILKKPGPDRSEDAVLQRGWTFSESSEEYTATTESGVAPIDFASPILEDDRILFGTERLGLMMIQKDNGQVLWRRRHKGESFSSKALVYQGRIFIGSNEGFFRSLDFLTGIEQWKIELPAPVRGAPISAGDRILVGTADESLHAIDPSTGKVLWVYKRPSFSGTSVMGGINPAMVGGRAWVGFSDGTLVALDPNDGSMKMEKSFRDNQKFTDIDARPVLWKDNVFIASYDGKLRSLTKDGKVNWEFPAGGARSPVFSSLQGDMLLFASSDGTVYAIQPESGRKLWSYSLKRGIPTGLVVLEEGNATLVVASSDQYVYALDLHTGKERGKVSLGKGSGIYSSLVADTKSRSIFLLSQFSRLYQLRVR